MDLFDIIGPVMIGPSSSHTAGAARIGLIARLLLGQRPVQAHIGFHGSFAKTWRGHGTDRALLGGICFFAQTGIFGGTIPVCGIPWRWRRSKGFP